MKQHTASTSSRISRCQQKKFSSHCLTIFPSSPYSNYTKVRNNVTIIPRAGFRIFGFRDPSFVEPLPHFFRIDNLKKISSFSEGPLLMEAPAIGFRRYTSKSGPVKRMQFLWNCRIMHEVHIINFPITSWLFVRTEVTEEATLFVIYSESGEEQLGVRISENGVIFMYRGNRVLESNRNISLFFESTVTRGEYDVNFL